MYLYVPAWTRMYWCALYTYVYMWVGAIYVPLWHFELKKFQSASAEHSTSYWSTGISCDPGLGWVLIFNYIQVHISCPWHEVLSELPNRLISRTLRCMLQVFLLHWHRDRNALKESVKLGKANAFLFFQALHKFANILFHALCIWRVLKFPLLRTWIRIPHLTGRPYLHQRIYFKNILICNVKHRDILWYTDTYLYVLVHTWIDPDILWYTVTLYTYMPVYTRIYEYIRGFFLAAVFQDIFFFWKVMLKCIVLCTQTYHSTWPWFR